MEGPLIRGCGPKTFRFNGIIPMLHGVKKPNPPLAISASVRDGRNPSLRGRVQIGFMAALIEAMSQSVCRGYRSVVFETTTKLMSTHF